jgi:hypothetical protein
MDVPCECCEVSATGPSLFQRSPGEYGVSEYDIENSAVKRVMPTELSSHETGIFNMQLRNKRHVARVIKNRDLTLWVNTVHTESYGLFLCSFVDTALEWLNISSRKMSL